MGRFFAVRNYHGKPNPVTQIAQAQYGLPQVLLQLRIQYADGSVARVNSDESWKVTDNGPILANNEFDGEEYDGTKELAGWNKTGYNDQAWKAVDLMSPGNVRIEAQPNENIRVKETLSPISVHETPRGSYILDMALKYGGLVSDKSKRSKRRYHPYAFFRKQ